MNWMVTQLYGDIAPRPTRSRQLTRLSVARLQSVGAGSGLETKRSAPGAHLSVDTYALVDYIQQHSSQSVKMLGSVAWVLRLA